jgi:hypothetical protein
MTDRRMFRITATNRRHVAEQVANLPEGYVIKAGPPTRTLEANAAMWAMLADISEQVVWHGRKLDTTSWKHVFTSSLKKQDVVPGLDGGFVVLGQSTSEMTKQEMSDLLELMAAFGAQQGVQFKQN